MKKFAMFLVLASLSMFSIGCKPEPTKPTTPPATEGKPAATEEKPGETKPADNKPADEKPAETKPAGEAK